MALWAWKFSVRIGIIFFTLALLLLTILYLAGIMDNSEFGFNELNHFKMAISTVIVILLRSLIVGLGGTVLASVSALAYEVFVEEKSIPRDVLGIAFFLFLISISFSLGFGEGFPFWLALSNVFVLNIILTMLLCLFWPWLKVLYQERKSEEEEEEKESD